MLSSQLSLLHTVSLGGRVKEGPLRIGKSGSGEHFSRWKQESMSPSLSGPVLNQVLLLVTLSPEYGDRLRFSS